MEIELGRVETASTDADPIKTRPGELSDFEIDFPPHLL